MGLDADEGRFSLVIGGPFHGMLRRLGLTRPDELPSLGAALGLALLAWMIPALLVIAQSLLDAGYPGYGYLKDGTAYTRYLLAIAVMIATERYADRRLILLARHFREAQLLPPSALGAFQAALARADRRAGSAIAEGLILVVVFALAGLSAVVEVDISGAGWEGEVVNGHVRLSWAGVAARYFSTPLFMFLVLRWIWRCLVWTALLFRLSRLPLQLMPLHPDQCAGLGFLTIYPSIFSGFVFALSAVVAASFVEDMGHLHHSAMTIWVGLGVWVALCLALVMGPLLVFAPRLYWARERALLEYGRLASQHHLAFHQKWILAGRHGEELIGSGDPSAASDLNGIMAGLGQLRLIPVDLPTLIQLLIAIGAPLLAVVLTQIPLVRLLGWLFGTLF